MCDTDSRCTDGITSCTGAGGCNGHGLLSPRGGTYRLKRDLSKGFPEWAVKHAECNGTGLTEHGCRKLSAAERKVLAGATWGKDERRYSLTERALIARPAPKRRTRKVAAAAVVIPSEVPAADVA